MLEAIILGIIQGFTEFLPISSSGHLIVVQHLFGMQEGVIALDVTLHLGTLLALIIFFWKDIVLVLRDKKAIGQILVVTIITGAIGVGGKDFFESLFSSPHAVAYGWIVTGLLLLSTKCVIGRIGRSNFRWSDAGILGLTQGMAIIPGISRSGTTIATLVLRGIEREKAFAYAFIVGIPAILGAAILEAKHIDPALQQEFSLLAMGFITSALAGFFSLWFLRFIIRRSKLHYFGWYCLLAATLTFLFIR